MEAILPAAEAELPSAESALPEAEFGIQLFIEEGEPVAVQTLQGVGPVGPNAAFRTVVEARKIAAAAENFAEGLAGRPAWEQWWYRTLEATRQWRQDLPVQDQIEIQRAIFDTARLLFGVE